ncbi:MAG: TAXI family TRAP transporter solute-binding subunit [Candidatus Bathyarchaeia archaeon]
MGFFNKSAITKAQGIAIVVIILVAAIAIGAYYATAPKPGPKPLKITISAGPSGGMWYILCGKLSDMLKEDYPGSLITVMEGGGLANLERVNDGTADFGTTMAHYYKQALEGPWDPDRKDQPLAKQLPNLRVIARFSPIRHLFWVVDESPLKSIEQIKEQKYPLKIASSPWGSTPVWAMKRTLEAYGITLKDIEGWGGKIFPVAYSQAADLIKDGHAEAFFGPVIPALTELAATKKLRILPLKEEALESLKKKWGYDYQAIPAGTQLVPQVTLERDALAVVEWQVFVCRKDLPDDVVYAFTKTFLSRAETIRKLHAELAAFDPSTAWKDVGGPLHPGAEKCFRDLGYMK